MKRVAAATCLIVVGITAGCNVEVNKGGNGENKDVKIATPLGGIAVKTNQTDAQDLGLPAYPNARIAEGKEGDKSANVNLGFGPFELRVKVVTYTTPDPRDEVLSFYRKALGVYGDVITCEGDKAIGAPAITKEGLSCNDTESSHQNLTTGDRGIQLKAGSRHHQHLVVFDDHGSETRFSLVALDLPHSSDGKQKETN